MILWRGLQEAPWHVRIREVTREQKRLLFIRWLVKHRRLTEFPRSAHGDDGRAA